MARKTKSEGDTRTAEEVRKEHEERVAEATAGTRENIEATEKMHREAQAKGAKAKPHVQEESESGVLVADHHVPGATVVAEREEGPHDMGQKDVGMGPLKVREAPKGAPAQPSARGRGAYTVSGTVDQAGRAYNFAHVGTGTDVGAQGVKTSGAQQVMTGGPHGSVNPVVYADVPAGGDLALPTYSDRLAQDPDISVAGVVPSGAVNPPRLHAPGPVMADRRLQPGEVVVHPSANVKSDAPNDPGGEELGMGPTRFHSPGGSVPVVEAPKPRTAERIETKGESVTQAPKPAKVKRGPKARRRKPASTRAKGGDRKVDEKIETREGEQRGEQETKEVKSTPTTEKKDAPVETGSTGGDSGEE